MRLIQLTVVAVLCSVTVHVPSVWADNTTCAAPEYVFPGEVADDVLPGNGAVYYQTAVVAGRSYSIAGWAPLLDKTEAGLTANLSIELYQFINCSQLADGASDADSEPGIDLAGLSGHDGDRKTIVPTFTGTLFIEVSNARTFPYDVHVRVLETTMFSPWWFVGGTNQAFVEIRNNTNEDVGLIATFFGSDGTVCGSTSLTLPANGNTAISVGVLGTCGTAVSGSAQIAFWAAPGAVAANITTIDGVQATSFDSPFTPRMVWGVSRR